MFRPAGERKGTDDLGEGAIQEAKRSTLFKRCSTSIFEGGSQAQGLWLEKLGVLHGNPYLTALEQKGQQLSPSP